MSNGFNRQRFINSAELRGGLHGLPGSAVACDIGSGRQRPARQRAAFGPSRKQVEVRTPLRRIAQSQHIAGAAVFLVSDESSWIMGETIVISGGHP